MKKKTKINNRLSVCQRKEKDISTISVIDDGNEMALSTARIDDYFYHNWIATNNYIIIYTNGCSFNNIPINIESVYSIPNRKLIKLYDPKIKECIESMIISRKSFDITCFLSAINDFVLDIVDEESQNEFISYLTSNNPNISNEDIKNYIIKAYPQLAKYKDYSHNISSVELDYIIEEVGSRKLYIHSMYQDIEELNDILKKKL